jgi:hypothetical protein
MGLSTDHNPTKSFDLVKVDRSAGKSRNVGASHRQFFRPSLAVPGAFHTPNGNFCWTDVIGVG